jgi:hypothetical protein
VIDMKHVRRSRILACFAAGVLIASAADRAFAAEAAQEAQPAVSGEALQNLNRNEAAPEERTPQPATPPAATREAPDPGAPAATPASSSRAAAAPRAGAARADRLELDTTVVTGNRELPKVLYIVPWKKADMGDLPAQPFNTLLDEVLTPVDRDVFRREVTYYEAVSSGGDAGGAAPARPAERSEK